MIEYIHHGLCDMIYMRYPRRYGLISTFGAENHATSWKLPKPKVMENPMLFGAHECWRNLLYAQYYLLFVTALV